MTFILHNFNITESSGFQMDIYNRGFLFGDGFFETMIYKGGKIQFFEDHYIRFNSALAAYQGRLLVPIDAEQMNTKLVELCKSHQGSSPIKIKLIAYRRSGGGYAPTDHEFETLVFTSDYKPQNKVRTNCVVYNQIKVQNTPISKFKNLCADAYVQAGIYMNKMLADEVILLGSHNVIAECLYSNIYWVKGNTIFTPAIESGCVLGISRKRIIEKIAPSPYTIEEGLFKIDHLNKADHVFNSNVGGISTIMKIGDYKYKPLPKDLISIID